MADVALLELVHAYLPGVLAVVGSGGKSSLLGALAAGLPGPVWLSTTTHLGVEQGSLAEAHFVVNPGEVLPAASQLNFYKSALLTGLQDSSGKWTAPDSMQMQALVAAASQAQIPLIVEADGARGKPLKAAASYEPQLPPGSRAMIVVFGLSGLGKPLGADWVHRPEIFSRVTGLDIGEKIGVAELEKVLAYYVDSCSGGLPCLAVFNQADQLNDPTGIRPRLEQSARRAGAVGVWVGSLRSDV